MACRRRPPSQKTQPSDAADGAAGRSLLAKPGDPRQAGLFDAPLPGWIKLCLPTRVDKPPVGPHWVYEVKWDVYRVSAAVADGEVTIRTRNGHDWTKRFPAIADAIGGLSVRSAVLDGEAVILDERGRSSFAELQADLDHHGPERAVLYAFDLLFLDSEDLRAKPLEQRRLALGAVILRGRLSCSARNTAVPAPTSSRSRASTSLKGSCRSGSTGPYRSGHRLEWLKTKCVQSDTFIIIGYQPGSGAVGTPIANIKVATFDGTRLRYAGAVVTGFSETIATTLRKLLDGIVASRCPIPA